MRVEVRIVPDDGDAQAGNAHVEVHHRRGEGFNIERTATIGGDAETYVLPPGGRLVVNTPLAIETPVYDHQQMASISPSQQRAAQTTLADAPDVAPPEPQGMAVRRTDTEPQLNPAAAQSGLPEVTANQNSQIFPETVTTPPPNRVAPQAPPAPVRPEDIAAGHGPEAQKIAASQGVARPAATQWKPPAQTASKSPEQAQKSTTEGDEEKK